jgi:hypothetical protein
MRQIVFIAALAFIPAIVSAQTPTDSVARALEKVSTGAELRVRAGPRTSRGLFAGMSDNALVLDTGSGSQIPIRFDTVDEMYKQGSYWKRGAIIGAVTGTVVLTGFGWLLISVACEQDDGCRNDYSTVVLYSIAVGGGGGGLVGAGLGYIAKRWIRIY